MNFDSYIARLTQKRIDLGIQEGTKVWMINSTKQGGGVAEMMPTKSLLC